MARSVVALLAALVMAAAPVAQAAELACAKDDESTGFTLRHLQSRLMVAALSCNQKEAYNNFVVRFTPELGSGGRALVAYFNRAGGGAQALNTHVTDLANAAAVHRATDPTGFCAATWNVFLQLQEKPELLSALANESLMTAVAIPRACNVGRGVTQTAIPANRPLAPQEAKAAGR